MAEEVDIEKIDEIQFKQVKRRQKLEIQSESMEYTPELLIKRTPQYIKVRQEIETKNKDIN